MFVVILKGRLNINYGRNTNKTKNDRCKITECIISRFSCSKPKHHLCMHAHAYIVTSRFKSMKTKKLQNNMHSPQRNQQRIYQEFRIQYLEEKICFGFSVQLSARNTMQCKIIRKQGVIGQ